MNAAGESQRLYSDEPTPVAYLGGFACCGWQLRPLDSRPLIVTPYIKFRLKTGKHELYVTAGQVFPWSTTGDSEPRKELATTSS